VHKQASTLAILRLTQYLSPWPQKHHNLQLQVGLAYQHPAGTYNFLQHAPRGYRAYTFADKQYILTSAEYLIPLWYIDNGFFTFPLYFESLYLLGFADGMWSLQTGLEERPLTWLDKAASVGVGLGLQMRLWYRLRLNITAGLAYLLYEKKPQFFWRL